MNRESPGPFNILSWLELDRHIVYVHDFTNRKTITSYGKWAELKEYWFHNKILEEDVYIIL